MMFHTVDMSNERSQPAGGPVTSTLQTAVGTLDRIQDGNSAVQGTDRRLPLRRVRSHVHSMEQMST